MNYTECLAYLEKLGDEVLTMKLGLQNIRALLEALDQPQLQFSSVVVAGTNGKGSVSHFLNAITTACGIRTGLYTSPHLVKVEERFVVGGSMVEPEVLASCLTRVKDTIARLQLPHHPTYFEILTAAAFLWFAQEEVELAVLEVGMGGRLDSTNVVDPLVCILTSVGLDHQKVLGDTLQEIAREKAGILRAGCASLMAPQPEPVRRVFLDEAASKKVHLHEFDDSAVEYLECTEGRYAFRFRGLRCQLQIHGRHQVQNAALAMEAFELLRSSDHQATGSCIKDGVESAQLMGRIQRVQEKPAVFLDGAHNQDSARALTEFLTQHTRRPRTLVLGMMRDKNMAEVLKILVPCFDRVYLTRVDSHRAADVEELHNLLPSGIPVANPHDAYDQALGSCATLVVTGSFYLVGEILGKI